MFQTVKSLEETKTLAETIALKLPTTRCLLLKGGLGAGKTTFSKYLIHALTGVSLEEIVSPTYSYVHLYPNKIAHFDLYRVTSFDALEELGLEEILVDKSVIKIIEWPEIALSLLPRNRLEITIEHLDNEQRAITLEDVVCV